ncbi:hypothetical protein [Myroides odoratus]|uniref:hypothetical protein n=1 Tax=Myroides odoratus TaxID=256 RepID=UPI0039AECECF
MRIPNTGATVLDEVTINVSKRGEQLLLEAGKFPRIDYKLGNMLKNDRNGGIFLRQLIITEL